MCERSTNSDVYSGSGGSIGSYGGSFKWDFFPSILNADFLRQGLATGNAADKSGAGTSFCAKVFPIKSI